jgi:hypothetical protein
LRDGALIGVMTYAFARIGAVVSMPVEDYFANGKRWWVRLHKKAASATKCPARHRLEAFLDRAAGIGGEPGVTSSARRAAKPRNSTGIPAYLEAGGTLENAQIMTAQESPRTTKLYDRTGDEITLDEVGRISI